MQDKNLPQSGLSAILLVVGILIVAFGAGYFFILPKFNNQKETGQLKALKKSGSVQTQQTKSLKDELVLYSDPQLGFEFKYNPKNYTIKDDSEEDFSQRGQTDFRKNFSSYVGYQPPTFTKAVTVLAEDNSFELTPFTVWVFENPNNLDQDKWYDNFWYYPFMWGVFDFPHKYMPEVEREATVAGQFIKYRLLDYQDGDPEYFYFPHQGRMVLVRVLTTKNNGEKILDTFKLTN